MNKLQKIVFVIGLFLLPLTMSAQCKVSLKSVKGTYTGECKKGKAHGQGVAKGTDSYTGKFTKGYPNGKGVYTFANGDVFTGTFKKGKKTGEGVLIKSGGNKVVGFWKSDEYIGKQAFAYKILRKSAFVTSSRFKRSNGPNEIRVSFLKNGKVVNRSLSIVPQSGSFSNIVSNRIASTVQGVKFPLWAKFNFGGQYIEVKINQPGSWDAKINVTN